MVHSYFSKNYTSFSYRTDSDYKRYYRMHGDTTIFNINYGCNSNYGYHAGGFWGGGHCGGNFWSGLAQGVGYGLMNMLGGFMNSWCMGFMPNWGMNCMPNWYSGLSYSPPPLPTYSSLTPNGGCNCSCNCDKDDDKVDDKPNDAGKVDNSDSTKQGNKAVKTEEQNAAQDTGNAQHGDKSGQAGGNQGATQAQQGQQNVPAGGVIQNTETPTGGVTGVVNNGEAAETVNYNTKKPTDFSTIDAVKGLTKAQAQQVLDNADPSLALDTDKTLYKFQANAVTLKLYELAGVDVTVAENDKSSDNAIKGKITLNSKDGDLLDFTVNCDNTDSSYGLLYQFKQIRDRETFYIPNDASAIQQNSSEEEGYVFINSEFFDYEFDATKGVLVRGNNKETPLVSSRPAENRIAISDLANRNKESE